MAKKRIYKGKRKPLLALAAAAVILLGSYFANSDLGQRLLDNLLGQGMAQPVSGPIDGGNLEVYSVDVGQGDCEFVRIPKEDGTYFNLLIDSGEYDQRSKILEFLQVQKIRRIDAVVVSHPHTDHMGSMNKIIEQYDIGTFYMGPVPDRLIPTTVSYEKMLDALLEKNMKIKVLEAGTAIPATDTVSIQVLGPVEGEEYNSLNDYSLVLKLTYGKNTFLFMGDSEIAAQKAIVNAGCDLQADVLKVSHHGSRNGMNETLYKQVNPQIALISCGEGNDYGHPHRETMELLNRNHCQIYRTDRDGTICILADGKSKPYKR